MDTSFSQRLICFQCFFFGGVHLFGTWLFLWGSSAIWHLVFGGVQLVAALRLLLVKIFQEKVSWQLFPLSSCENLMA